MLIKLKARVKKAKSIYLKTYEENRTKKRVPYHMGSQQFKTEDDQARRQKKIDKAIVALEELNLRN